MMRRQHEGRAIRRVIMNHQSNGQSPRSIPWRHHDPHDPRRQQDEGTRRARKSFLSGTSGSKWAVAGAEAPAPASHSASESTSDRARASSAGVRSTGTRAPLLGSPRAPGEARGGEGQLHIRVPPKWVRSTGTPPRRKAPRGPWAESDGGSRPTVRCTSTEPADTDSPITAHATLRTRDNNPDERTTATRASGNTRARSCPHRWTRRGSQRDKQQAGREGSRRDKGQAAGGNDRDNHAGGCLPRLGRRRPGLGSRHVTPRARGLPGEPTHGRAHGNLMPRPRQRRALLAIPKLGGPHQPHQPGLRLASRGSGHRSRTRRISKGQGTGRGGKRRGQSCGGLSAPARKTEARPRQRAHHATSSGIARRANAWARARQFNATPTPAHVSQASDLRAGAAATAAGTSRQADGRAAAASTLARARQMNATPTPRISSPNAPGGLERVPKTVAGIGSSAAGKRVIDAGNTSGHEAPHFSPSLAAAHISPAAGLWAPGQRAPWPGRGHPPKEQ
ncbi:hypothetical protein Peur_058550 [Populus x canadensis]